jgi:sugar phosphate isomerase/epimerase
MGEGQLGALFAPLADAMRADGYDGVVSFESVYHPGNGDFEAGFRQCVSRFKELFSSEEHPNAPMG